MTEVGLGERVRGGALADGGSDLGELHGTVFESVLCCLNY